MCGVNCVLSTQVEIPLYSLCPIDIWYHIKKPISNNVIRFLQPIGTHLLLVLYGLNDLEDLLTYHITSKLFNIFIGPTNLTFLRQAETISNGFAHDIHNRPHKCFLCTCFLYGSDSFSYFRPVFICILMTYLQPDCSRHVSDLQNPNLF